MRRIKKITVDLRTAGHFGTSCKCLEMFEDFRSKGYQIDFMPKKWGSSFKDTGLVFDRESKEYKKGTANFLHDLNTHPDDFYKNLMIPTFENVNYIREDGVSNRFKKAMSMIKPIFSTSHFTHIDYVSIYMDRLEMKRYHQQKIDNLYDSNFSFQGILLYVYFVLYFKIFRKFKIYTVSKGFMYKLHEDLMDDNVQKIIDNAKKDNIPYILISANWDDNKKFEVLDDRLRGVLADKIEFNSMVEYVKELDKFAKEGKLKFVLASKKAVDWDNIIESDFLDLRNFEEKGLLLSQSIYIVQEITSMSINWPSTYSIWITHCSNILHLTWRDGKDTAKWARNTLHKEPVEKALKLIGVV